MAARFLSEALNVTATSVPLNASFAVGLEIGVVSESMSWRV